MIIDEMKKRIEGKNKVLVLPEGDDIRILKAACRLSKENLGKPLLLGEINKISKLAEENNLDISAIKVLNPLDDCEFENNVNKMFELRKGKNSLEECRKLLAGRNYYAIMLLYNGLADAALGGATYSTADTIRPALQIIKTKPGCNIVSSCFALLKEGSPTLIFGDCGVNVNPTSEQLCDIAISSVETARLFGVDPRVAFLSFSTKGSAKSEEVSKVQSAVELMKERDVNFMYDGELQFDAAYDKATGEKKAPNSPVAGKANVFVFPDLQSGNIGYKIAQRLGGYEALGPILQGIKMPVNDLSRGCNEEEVYKMAILTIAQSL
jgi:phosphate acetyltransferase